MQAPVEEGDVRVRAAVYEAAMNTGSPPTANQLAAQLALPLTEIRKSLEHLAAGRALVLQLEHIMRLAKARARQAQ